MVEEHSHLFEHLKTSQRIMNSDRVKQCIDVAVMAALQD